MRTINTDHFIQRLQCPVCNSMSIERLYELPYEDEKIKNYLDNFYDHQGGVEHDYLKNTNYCLNTCLECELVYQKYIPNDFLMNKLYEEWINPKIVFEEQERYPLWYYENYSKQIINLISFFDRQPNELKFFDFGMGWGKWCLMAKAYGCQVYGLELSKARIDYAINNGVKVLSEGELIDYKFDYINTDQVFEHIPNPLNTLKEIIKCLKPNGVIKISVPNGKDIHILLEKMDWNAPKGHVNSLNVVAPLEHINCFKTKTLLVLAEQCGLTLIDLPNVRNQYKSKNDFIKKTLKSVFNSKEKSSTSLFFKLETGI